MKCITLKIELCNSDSKRTITVPAGLSLVDLSKAIQAVMNWNGSHIWDLTDGNSVRYSEERADEDNSANDISAEKVSVEQAFPNRGSSLLYTYDFGDGWEHKITRMADPKSNKIACLKTQGTDGIDDIGGAWRLADFIEKWKKGGELDEEDLWVFETPEYRKIFLKGPSTAELTERLRISIGSAKLLPVKEDEDDSKGKSLEEESKKLLSNLAVMVDRDNWDILEEAMKNGGGKVEFEDEEGEIRKFLSSLFKEIKFKRIRSGNGRYELTVPNKWVEMYKNFGGETWNDYHYAIDLIESYTCAAVYMFGVVTMEELQEIILHYDKELEEHFNDFEIIMQHRMLCPYAPFHLNNKRLLLNSLFPPESKDKYEKEVARHLTIRKTMSRWLPASRDNFLEWIDGPVYNFEDPEKNFIKYFNKIFGKGSVSYCKYALSFVQDSFYQGENTSEAIDSLKENKIVDISAKSPDIQAEMTKLIRNVGRRMRSPLLNGHSREELGISPDTSLVDYFNAKGKSLFERHVESQVLFHKAYEEDFDPVEPIRRETPKVGRNAPCSCGSGKKYKHCCGKDD